MTFHNLTPAQAEEIRKGFAPSLNYLYKLLERMKATGFPEDDRVRKRVAAAQQALADLNHDLGDIIQGTLGGGQYPDFGKP